MCFTSIFGISEYIPVAIVSGTSVDVSSVTVQCLVLVPLCRALLTLVLKKKMFFCVGEYAEYGLNQQRLIWYVCCLGIWCLAKK